MNKVLTFDRHYNGWNKWNDAVYVLAGTAIKCEKVPLFIQNVDLKHNIVTKSDTHSLIPTISESFGILKQPVKV